MMGKMLMLASVPSMIGAFNMDNIALLMDKGYEIHVACDFKDRSVWSDEKVKDLILELKKRGISCHQIDFTRSVSNLKRHRKAYGQTRALLKKEQFDFIHCHAPIASIIARYAAHKENCKVIYTCHGFHFYQGAPIQNWIFYPIEKYFSGYTDILVTINDGDYQIAKNRFHAKKVVKIPGVGLDNEAVHNRFIPKEEKRRELGIPKDAFVILSVGNLYHVKNQDVIIKAVAKIHDKGIYYLIAGEGEKKEEYQKMIHGYGMEDRIRLIGFRDDISELCYASDVFAHPSKREGLGMAPLEAMAAGLPILTSNVGGINSYSVSGKTGYKYAPDDVWGFAHGIQKLKNHPGLRKKMGKYNIKVAKEFDISVARRKMSEVYDMIQADADGM
ncbi:MAG: glycosyltransferase family 4 protein [Lachnospiraceae bacterium]|nr:glycosyltransferase family 4 protein [Lachnospiraceae bacterium]